MDSRLTESTDFVPNVLDQTSVDRWYKTDDQESFSYARRLIAEEGLLVGGSSGSAFAAMVKSIKDLDIGEGSNIVVVLPDSVRNYLTKFINDDWLSANHLLPFGGGETVSSPVNDKVEDAAIPFKDATVRNLDLKPVESIESSSRCSDAVAKMRDKGFDQLPVLGSTGPGRLVGLVTLGNILSRVNQGRAAINEPVSKVMFDFSKVAEVTTDPRNISNPYVSHPQPDLDHPGGSQVRKRKHGRKFIEITMETPLPVLSSFFEWNSAAVITEKGPEASVRPVAVATKVDLLGWLVKQQGV